MFAKLLLKPPPWTHCALYPEYMAELRLSCRGNRGFYNMIFEIVYGRGFMSFHDDSPGKVQFYECDSQSQKKWRSYMNMDHLEVITRIQNANPDLSAASTIILTPYLYQRMFLDSYCELPVYTIDAFL
ncbi:hypothetical protein QR680_004231 [Steinernema hermaphroditum]|uniref:Uncharacterized protein n=1 Tax=Steinernema hermaphroditum TaxID=289476 RepID=A0AA39HN18_9BILA|nr:hypothetical protein QR680_004231 [Steinernema hermaphroditum]